MRQPFKASVARLLAAVLALSSVACGRSAIVDSALPLKRVVIYRNGVGYFERGGLVDEPEVRFKMRESEVGDFLATLAVIEKGGKYFYKYGNGERPFIAKQIALPYKSGNTMATRVVTAYFSHHGPIIRATDGKWIAVKMMNDPMNALTQSYSRTKAKNYAEFSKVMEIRTNSSNNTIYADADGNIAYFHGNFMPKRDTVIDFSKPVDGSDPKTEWQGLHDVKETITLFNPNSGWLFNTNNWPWEAAGTSSPRRQDYPKYMSAQGENARGPHAIRSSRSSPNRSRRCAAGISGTR